MATPSLNQHYTIKEFQLLVKDAPVVPAEIQPFAGIQFRCSSDIFRAFRQLAEMPVESFLVVHLDGNNRRVGMNHLQHWLDDFQPGASSRRIQASDCQHDRRADLHP